MTATQEPIPATPRGLAPLADRFLPASMILLALAIRLISAHSKFLNADEAMHYLLSAQPWLGDAYHASLGTAHPPLLILLLHYWGMISSGELFLRLPSVLAGTAAGWFLYLWLREVNGRNTAVIALGLLLFSPALIYTAAEIRQYALLLAFLSSALYSLDKAFLNNSPEWMLLSALALYFALLTHYSALIVAAALWVYGAMRLNAVRSSTSVIAAWVIAQMGAGAIAAFLWNTHVSVIRNRSLTRDVAESYLRNSLFHPGQENILTFLVRANLRLFHFLFSQGAVSILAMVLFVAGVAQLLRRSGGETLARKPGPRQLGTLLLLPFVINCITAIAGVYPYGGTRHNSYLAIFAMPAMAVALARWHPQRSWAKPAAIVAGLALCNLAASPAGSYIKSRNQKKPLMEAAVRYLETSAPPHSVIVTDYESGLLLSYYVCHRDITHAGAPAGFFYRSRCNGYESVSLLPKLWVFRAETFPQQMEQLAETLPPSSSDQVWLFQAGFIVDREPEFQALLSRYGCSSPAAFGDNVLVCRIELPRKACTRRGDKTPGQDGRGSENEFFCRASAGEVPLPIIVSVGPE